MLWLLDFVASLVVSKYLLRTLGISELTVLSKQMNIPDNATASHTASRMAGEERRMQILRVAVNLFSQRGFSGTTTREIAQAAGVSEAMVFRHFATKQELYSAILDHKAFSDSAFDPRSVVAKAVAQRDDRAVFEGLAFSALEHHESDTEFHRLLLHAALERHELAEMFWERNVRPLYEFLGGYIRQRQLDGAIIDLEPAVVVRAFVGMIIHHSLNNNLWDPKRSLLKISNEEAARAFSDILLVGIINRQPSEQARSDGRKASHGRFSENRPKK